MKERRILQLMTLLNSDEYGSVKNRELRQDADELLALALKQTRFEARRKRRPSSWFTIPKQKRR